MSGNKRANDVDSTSPIQIGAKTMNNCLFCNLAAGKIPSNKVYEDETILAFYDVSPIAPVHVLIIPKEHIASPNGVSEENVAVIAHIFQTIPLLSKQLGLQNGYRVITNCGKDGGQTVPHLHFHLLGGKAMNWSC